MTLYQGKNEWTKMIKNGSIIILCLMVVFALGCTPKNPSAEFILGNPDYPAFSYGGYRGKTREFVPSVDELKEDMRILQAMGVKLIRTYNTKQYAHAANLLKAISQLKKEEPNFEMYVMLGTWIECEGAWTSSANHRAGNVENNTAEIGAAIEMVNEYPDIVKVIAVGNEAMVQWAVNYYVYPNVILRWVDHLKDLRNRGEIPEDTWITSSDNYESWGGGAENYQTDELAALIEAVDFVSLHTYPFHDSHYNPAFWAIPEEEEELSKLGKIDAAMVRARDYAISQYQGAADYFKSLGISKPIHIGETGWSTVASSSYGATGSHAADEYKEKLYYESMREWTNEAGMSCFYFEAFDEQWKDAGDSLGSENHFGLINLGGQAKYALWEMVDKGIFDGLTRNGVAITKTYNGDEGALMKELLIPPLASEIGILEIKTINEVRKAGQTVEESTYLIVHESLIPDMNNSITYPSASLKLNPWEGTCSIEMSKEGVIEVVTGTGAWWGCALEIQSAGEDLGKFESGHITFDIKGETSSYFNIGYQTGLFAEGTQVNNFVTFGPDRSYSISENWTTYSIPISELDKGGDLTDVTGLVYFSGDSGFDGKPIFIRNLYYTSD